VEVEPPFVTYPATDKTKGRRGTCGGGEKTMLKNAKPSEMNAEVRIFCRMYDRFTNTHTRFNSEVLIINFT
jgi:hypothetical protein